MDGRAQYSGGRAKRLTELRIREGEVFSRRGRASTEAKWVDGMAAMILQQTDWRTGAVEKPVRLLK